MSIKKLYQNDIARFDPEGAIVEEKKKGGGGDIVIIGCCCCGARDSEFRMD
jgi:hypothetical protein